MKALQPVSVAVGAICAVLALSTSTGCPIIEPGDPEQVSVFHPLVILLGLGCGLSAILRARRIDRDLWRLVDDATLTSGERELAHREATGEKKAAAVMLLAAPLGLSLWLAYQFKGEGFGSELLLFSALGGFGLGLGAGTVWRKVRDRGPEF